MGKGIKQFLQTVKQQRLKDGTCTAKPFNDVVRSHLPVALADGNSASGKLLSELYTSVVARLSEMVFEGILPPDSSQGFRGLQAISCKDQFSGSFLGSCVAKISDAWNGVKLKIVQHDRVPRKQVVRIKL